MGRAGAMGGGMRVQAPPGVFFRIPSSHFFLYMRVDIAVYRSGHEIIGRMKKRALRVEQEEWSMCLATRYTVTVGLQ